MQRVKDAVRLRNGIPPHESVKNKELHTLDERERITEEGKKVDRHQAELHV